MAYSATRYLTMLNAERLAETVAGPHTICVTGYPRGGTSALALMLRELGLFMGEQVQPRSHEDITLREARGDAEEVARIARRYDEAHQAWGFKAPIGGRMARDFVPMLRNPIEIVVMRNPIAIIRGRLARGGSVADDQQRMFLESLSALHGDAQRFARSAGKRDGPIIFVEYERLLAGGAEFARELAETLGLPTEGELFERAALAISEPGYRRFSGDTDQRPFESAGVAKRLFRE